MKTQFTPAPWHIDNTLVAVGKRADNGSTDLIADLHHSVFQDQRQANARLIAAAPELLAACQTLLEAMPKLDEHSEQSEWDAIYTANAAIAKAIGQ